MLTIRASSEIDRVFREGARAARGAVVVLCAQAPGPEGRIAVVAGKKVGNAVRRNRAKRVLRESCRRSGGPWPGKDVVLVARAGTPKASVSDLDADLRSAVRSLGVDA